jgi:hypothetical protein
MRLGRHGASGASAALLLVACAALAGAATVMAPDEGAKQEVVIKSLKEKLSDKASDEQRVDNCRVPLDRRGSKPRPDCPPSPQAGKATDEPAAAQ